MRVTYDANIFVSDHGGLQAAVTDDPDPKRANDDRWAKWLLLPDGAVVHKNHHGEFAGCELPPADPKANIERRLAYWRRRREVASTHRREFDRARERCRGQGLCPPSWPQQFVPLYGDFGDREMDGFWAITKVIDHCQEQIDGLEFELENLPEARAARERERYANNLRAQADWQDEQRERERQEALRASVRPGV